MKYVNFDKLNYVQQTKYYEFIHNVTLNAMKNDEYITNIYYIAFNDNNDINFAIIEYCYMNDNDSTNVEQFVVTNDCKKHCIDDIDYTLQLNV